MGCAESVPVQMQVPPHVFGGWRTTPDTEMRGISIHMELHPHGTYTWNCNNICTNGSYCFHNDGFYALEHPSNEMFVWAITALSEWKYLTLYNEKCGFVSFTRVSYFPTEDLTSSSTSTAPTLPANTSASFNPHSSIHNSVNSAGRILQNLHSSGALRPMYEVLGQVTVNALSSE